MPYEYVCEFGSRRTIVESDEEFINSVFIKIYEKITDLFVGIITLKVITTMSMTMSPFSSV